MTGIAAEPAAARASIPDGVEAILAKAGRENFPVALAVVPAAERRALEAIYGFARLVDDVGDQGDASPAERLAALEEIEADLDRAYLGDAEHPLLRRLEPVLHRHGLPREPFARLIEANRQDQRVSRYATFAELRGYCSLSADPVGRLVLHVFRTATPERVELSDAVCTALQLAEHFQDVGEDLARGRVYLPQEDLERFGVDEDDLAGPPTAAFRRLLGFEVARARGLLAAGVPLVASLRGPARLAVAGYVAGGRAALDAVERSGYDVLARSPAAGTARRLAAAARVLLEAA